MSMDHVAHARNPDHRRKLQQSSHGTSSKYRAVHGRDLPGNGCALEAVLRSHSLVLLCLGTPLTKSLGLDPSH